MLLERGWLSWIFMIVGAGMLIHTYIEGTKYDPLTYAKAYWRRLKHSGTSAQQSTGWRTDYMVAFVQAVAILLPTSFMLYVILRIDIPISIEALGWSAVVIYFYVRRLEKVGKTEEKREILNGLSRFVGFFGGIFVVVVMLVLIGQTAIFIG